MALSSIIGVLADVGSYWEKVHPRPAEDLQIQTHDSLESFQLVA